MSTQDTQAGAISFAHLAGITAPVHAAKADAPDDDKKDAKKADDDTDDESMESDEDDKKDEDKKEDAKAESDEPDEDDKKDDKAKKATSEFQRGYAAANARLASVLGSRAFARNPVLGANLLVNSTMGASAIIATMRDTPAAADAGRSARNPNLGVSAPAVAATTDARWGAAFKRAGISK